MGGMKKRLISVAAGLAAVFVLLGYVVVFYVVGNRAPERVVDSTLPTVSAVRSGPHASNAPQAVPPSDVSIRSQDDSGGFLFGRVTTATGSVYEGRLRFGGDEEAFWTDYFNGFKTENPWAEYVPAERLQVSRAISIFGVEIARRERQVDLGRPFMARFGDMVRVDAQGRDVRVTLKSGTVFVLDRLEAGDFDDGLRVWDGERGVVDLDSLQIRHIEFRPNGRIGAGSNDPAPGRLYGSVRTEQSEFTGFVQWNREKGVVTDALDGHCESEGDISVRFDTIRSIARESRDSCRVMRLDGREIVLSGTRDVAEGNRGVYVDDRRYGRVLVAWDAFRRLDVTTEWVGSGPVYGDFSSGRPLVGTVVTRDGERLDGRLVFDLDESETTETLDAPSRGVDYTIPFALIASIGVGGVEETVRVRLADGEELDLERRGDLGERNAGLLVFVDGRERPDYVPWTAVERIEFRSEP